MGDAFQKTVPPTFRPFKSVYPGRCFACKGYYDLGDIIVETLAPADAVPGTRVYRHFDCSKVTSNQRYVADLLNSDSYQEKLNKTLAKAQSRPDLKDRLAGSARASRAAEEAERRNAAMAAPIVPTRQTPLLEKAVKQKRQAPTSDEVIASMTTSRRKLIIDE